MNLKGGYSTEDPRLDRVPSGHTEHLDRYPLTVETLPAQRTAMVMGVNWYSNFDRPQPQRIRGRQYLVIGQGDLGRVRGGHAVCLPHWGVREPAAWWAYYDQGTEGRCVEFAWTRAMSLHNRERYDITSRHPYHAMQERDYWAGCYLGHGGGTYEGTSVDAGGQVMRALGPVPYQGKGKTLTLEQGEALTDPARGIAAYRWSPDWQMTRTALSVPDWMPGVPMLQNWGMSYPRRVILLDEAGDRIQREDGEFALITDR